MRGSRYPRTNRLGGETQKPADLVERSVSAAAPHRIWAADSTYVPTNSGFVYVSFALDVFSHMMVAGQTSSRMLTALASEVLIMGLFARGRDGHNVDGLTHHADRGVQYRAARYTQAFEDAAEAASVGSKGDSCDTRWGPNSSDKAELVSLDGPYEGRDDVETATAQWVHCLNTGLLRSMLGYRTLVEVEAEYFASDTFADAV